MTAVDRDEIDRLRKRFMKLDKVRRHHSPHTVPSLLREVSVK